MKRRDHERLTVLMPLHRAVAWLDVVSHNIACCPSDCRIIVSDLTQCDDAIALLSARHRGDRRIWFRRGRKAPDWRTHVNELMRLVRTDYLSIQAQDDSIHCGYYESLIAGLETRSDIGLAFGVIDALDLNGTPKQRLGQVPFALGESAPWHEAIALDCGWNLGIPYRGVLRTKLAWPIPIADHDFEDQIWVFGIALTSHLIEVPEAIYAKRYHADNTHTEWTPLVGTHRFEVLKTTIETRLAHDPAAMAAAKDALRIAYNDIH